MGQRKLGLQLAHFLFGVSLLILGCDKPAETPSTGPTFITVASLVPAATDLIEGMGAGDHLVAISNWDPDRPEYAKLPRVGDYRSIDWEKLSQLRPTVMITQFREDKKPGGLEEKSRQLNITLVNVQNNTLAELYSTLDQLGNALQLRERSDETKRKLKDQIDAVGKSVANRPRVKTLIVRTASGMDVVGGRNFMDELLTLAGGENVLPSGENSFPTIDRELLLKLDPEVILQLLPGSSPQVVEQAQAFWKTIPSLSAVRNNRIHILTQDYLLLPGSNVGKLAELFRDKLHPEVKP